MGKIRGSCKQREELWERWMDACGALAEGREAERAEEQRIRHLLNDHMQAPMRCPCVGADNSHIDPGDVRQRFQYR